MNSQQLDKSIQIQHCQVTKGASGGVLKEWTAFVSQAYAAIRHLSGNEKQATTAAGGQVGVARTEFRIRFRPGITPQMRIVHGSQFYNINHVNPLYEGGDWLILTSETGVNNG